MSDKQKNDKQEYDKIEIDGVVYKTTFTTKFKDRKKWVIPDPGAVTTYIPGTILQIYVSEGDEVKAGDLLALLEAMKMHNKILAPHSGVIDKVYISEGDKVHKDDLMFEIVTYEEEGSIEEEEEI